MLIGVTGLIGSGKSTVTKVFASLGAHIIDADAIGKEVVENKHKVLYRLVLEFGESILTKDKRLNRRQLGKLAFASPEKTKLLNSIVHPALLQQLDILMADSRRRGEHAVVDAALLINWGYHQKMDVTILVTSTIKNRMNRLAKIGLSEKEFIQRSKSQLPLTFLKKHADIIITNNADLETLQSKAVKLYRELTEKG